MLAENSPERMMRSLKGMGLAFSFLMAEMIYPAIEHTIAPNQMITEGYWNRAGGSEGSMDS